MKNYLRSIIAVVVLTLFPTHSWAAKEFTFIYQLEGEASTAAATGTITASISGTTATLTVTPVEGNYIEIDDISVVKTIDGANAQTRAPGFEEPIEIALSGTANPTGETTYTFTVTDDTFDYEVTANFRKLIDISGATVTLEESTFTYDGEEKKPKVSSVVVDGETLASDNYEVTYSNNVNPAAADAATHPTVTIEANKLPYSGKAEKAFTINKVEATLAFSKATAEATYGAAFTAPTLTKTPATLEGVTFKSSDTDVATVDADGKVTIVGEGETKITASFAGNDNYEAAEASYTLTVNPGKMEVTAEGFEGTYDGQPHGITLNAPEGAKVEYLINADTDEWSTNAPTFTDAGSYTVSYQVSKDNYETVEGEAIVEINKAPVEITKAPRAREGLTYTGYPQVLITAGECGTGGTMMYALNSIADAWSENLPTATEPGTYTVYYSVSSDDDNHEYQGDTKSLTVTIANVAEPEPEEGTFKLWIGGVQVTKDNQTDILNDGINKARFFFNDKSSQLVITNNQDASIAIESGLDELTIFLNGSEPSYLNRIWSSVGGREMVHPAKGKLTITTYPNIPGMLYLKTDHLMGVIGYFSSVTLDESTNTILMDPADGAYDGTALLTAEGEIAKSATIGQYIIPMTYETKTFPTRNFLNEDGSDKDLSNTTVDNENKILLTANTKAPNPEENDGYDSTDRSIVLNSALTTRGVEQVAADVVAGNLIPGSGDFARVFHGITFMVPDGSGRIFLNVSIEPSYRLRVKVLNDMRYWSSASASIVRGASLAVVEYQVRRSSYVLVWLEEDANYSRESTRGRRETAHGRIYSIQLVPEQVATKNPLSFMEDFPKAEVEEVETGSTPVPTPPTAIDRTAYSEDTDSGLWYNIEGQQIDRPTKKGVYIRNRKKIVIR